MRGGGKRGRDRKQEGSEERERRERRTEWRIKSNERRKR